EEYRGKVGWGHSSLEYAVDVALAAGVVRLVLFHHDPQHDDPAMERIESHARARATAHGSGLDVLAAREGLELEVRGNGATRAAAGRASPSSCAPTAPWRPTWSAGAKPPPPITSPGPSARRCCARGFARGSRAR